MLNTVTLAIITSSINFAVLEKIATDEGLSRTFSDEQLSFLFRNNLDMYWSKFLNNARNTRSMNRKLTVYGKVPSLIVSFLDTQFYAQVLTKGISLDYPPRTDNPKLERFFNTGIKLQVGNSNTRVSVDITVDPDQHMTYEAQLNSEGELVFFDNNISPTVFFSDEARCVIKEGEDILLDTSDREALKQVTERSGYEYDLAA